MERENERGNSLMSSTTVGGDWTGGDGDGGSGGLVDYEDDENDSDGSNSNGCVINNLLWRRLYCAHFLEPYDGDVDSLFQRHTALISSSTPPARRNPFLRGGPFARSVSVSGNRTPSLHTLARSGLRPEENECATACPPTQAAPFPTATTTTTTTTSSLSMTTPLARSLTNRPLPSLRNGGLVRRPSVVIPNHDTLAADPPAQDSVPPSTIHDFRSLFRERVHLDAQHKFRSVRRGALWQTQRQNVLNSELRLVSSHLQKLTDRLGAFLEEEKQRKAERRLSKRRRLALSSWLPSAVRGQLSTIEEQRLPHANTTTRNTLHTLRTLSTTTSTPTSLTGPSFPRPMWSPLADRPCRSSRVPRRVSSAPVLLPSPRRLDSHGLSAAPRRLNAIARSNVRKRSQSASSRPEKSRQDDVGTSARMDCDDDGSGATAAFNDDDSVDESANAEVTMLRGEVKVDKDRKIFLLQRVDSSTNSMKLYREEEDAIRAFIVSCQSDHRCHM
eukprot:TRINITY_DN13224_c0_g1_i1.p1 TRINITY_DN13224_c0_g1~~TRINITY_DN13224_c0_g1_i1.p1  ORF type:complete len:501 (+),score=75.49 TRINITY_DN13224_c0_g1_i1:523-2025(+)